MRKKRSKMKKGGTKVTKKERGETKREDEDGA